MHLEDQVMNLRQLQYFVEVSEAQSVTKAAARLNLAQPALTRHIQTLQRELGVQLFVRSGRGIVLTKAGELFRDHVKRVLRDLDRAQSDVQALARCPGGHIDIGLPNSTSLALTRLLVQRAQQLLPGVTLRIIDGWTGFIVEWLLSGRLDLGVIYDHAQKTNLLQVEPLATERQFLICAPNDLIARWSGEIPLALVAELPLVLPSRDHGLRLAFEQQMHAVGLEPRVELEVESPIGMKQFVEAGGMYTILPKSEIGQELAAGSLVPIKTCPAIDRTLSMAWSKGRVLDSNLQKLKQILCQEAALLIESGTWGRTFIPPPMPAELAHLGDVPHR